MLHQIDDQLPSQHRPSAVDHVDSMLDPTLYGLEEAVALAVVTQGEVVGCNEAWAELNMPLGDRDEWKPERADATAAACVDLDGLAVAALSRATAFEPQRWFRECDGMSVELRFVPLERRRADTWLAVVSLVSETASERCH